MKPFQDILKDFPIRLRETRSSEEEVVDYRQGKVPVREVLVLFLGSVALLFMMSFIFYDAVFPVLILIIPFYIICFREYKLQYEEKRRYRLKQEFLGAVLLFSDHLRSGYSPENAIVESIPELVSMYGETSDIVTEWKRMAAAFRLNRTIEETFSDFSERSGIRQIRDFSDIFSVVKRSGGRLREVVTMTASGISEQFTAEEQVETVLAAKKMEERIMVIMPAAILLYIRTASPELLEAMYSSFSGRIIMTVCLFVYVMAVIWAERIMKIKEDE